MLSLSLPGDLDAFDPRYVISSPSILAIKMVFEGLMCTGPDGKITPAIAESLEISEDQKFYTFHLRPCQWSNGDEITAFDFEYTWKTLLDPNLNTKGKHNFYAIKNAEAIVHGKLPLSALGVKVIDPKTLVVELEHPAPYFLEIVASSSFFPVNSRIDRESPDWAKNAGEQFVCNGPFLLSKHKQEDEMIFIKNPDYWDAEHVQLPGIKICIIKDATTMLSMFEKNELDWAGKPLSRLPLDAIPHLREKGEINQFPCAGLEWYVFNVHAFPFNNKKMRQAFTYAIDRQAIADHVLKEGETPALGILPPSLATQTQPFFTDNNLTLARKLFDEALEELGLEKKDLPVIKFNFSNSRLISQKVTEALQQQWKEAFGILVKLDQREAKVHFDTLAKGDFQIGGAGWVSWLRDPIYIMQTFRFASDSVNFPKWEDPEYQRLLDATDQELDPIKRKQFFNEAEKILMDEFPVAPLYYMTMAYAVNKQLKNVYLSELFEVDFRWAYFEEESQN
ncbi:MAG TPA: peptide ABC transporter substrate-binding protein [Rhabdochlamydiaceae bacterium]|nr:peptide ABC transporter substrate-binding protein [Rhabdochlamydiaceae bacterium]